MECTLAALITCFNLSGLYVDSGLSWQDVGEPEFHQRAGVINHDWGAQTVLYRDVTIGPENPYGRISLGYEVEFRSFSWRVEASHISSIATNEDRGINSVSLSARWFPFGGRR